MPLIDSVVRSTANSAKSQASVQPIRTLSRHDGLARVVHPAALVTLFLATFKSLVVDPPTTMRVTLMATAAIQLAYAVACLPPKAGAKKSEPGSPSALVVRV